MRVAVLGGRSAVEPHAREVIAPDHGGAGRLASGLGDQGQPGDGSGDRHGTSVPGAGPSGHRPPVHNRAASVRLAVERGRAMIPLASRGLQLFCTRRDEEEPMPAQDRLQVVRDSYGAYESGDRQVIERCLTDDFVFYSPADAGIDRATYFERCWPNAERIDAFEFKRLVEAGDEVVVT